MAEFSHDSTKSIKFFCFIGRCLGISSTCTVVFSDTESGFAQNIPAGVVRRGRRTSYNCHFRQVWVTVGGTAPSLYHSSENFITK